MCVCVHVHVCVHVRVCLCVCEHVCVCVFSLAKDRETDMQNYKQMGRRRGSGTYRLSERRRNSWWLHGQRSGDKEK